MWCNTEGEGREWCGVMEGGDTGGYSHGVLKSMTNNECRSSFHFVFVCRRSLSSVGASFPYTGGRFRTWAVVVWWWWWWRSAVAGLSISLPRCCQRRGTWLPCQQRKWGEGVFTHLLVVVAASDVAPRCHWVLVAIGAVGGWCVVILPLLWHGRRLL